MRIPLGVSCILVDLVSLGQPEYNWPLGVYASVFLPLIIVSLHGIRTITQLSASYSILTKSHISHLKMDLMWVAVVFETILHSPEMDPKILYPTLQKWILKNYFPLSQHESTLHNIYIQNFWSLGNADTPLLTRGIWKYLFWVAVVFETIYHSGFALVEYGFKYHCYPQKIFSYPTHQVWGIYNYPTLCLIFHSF